MLQNHLKPNCIEVGVDEAGRGCLAGDVYAAAVVLPEGFSNDLLNDSKQLSERQRNELREIIEDWMYEHTKSGRYNLVDDSELYMQFDDVRIELYDERGRPIAANNFARDLVRFLKAEPYNIELIKVMNQGLGQATIIIGDK